MTTPKHRGSLYEAAVYKCRVCDSIIPSAECAESHGQDCRPVSNYKTKSWKYKQMEEILFPCPVVVLHELPSNLNEKTLGKYLATVKPKHNPIEGWQIHKSQRYKFTEEEIRERIRKMQETGEYPPRISRFYPRDRHFPEPELIRTVKIPSKKKVEALKRKYEEKKKKIKEAKGKPCSSNYLEVFSSSSSDDDDGGDADPQTNQPEPDNPFICPMKTCGIKLRERSQLKSHFIMHLENNPWVCPYPDCNVKLDSQTHFQRHIGWHMGRKLFCCRGCGQTYLTKKEMKKHVCSQQHHPISNLRKRNSSESFEKVYGYLKSHYEHLKSKGLLLGDSDERDIYFDFNYKINMNSIMESDPVFIKVCEENPASWDLLVGDESGTSSSSGKRNPYSNPFFCPLERCSLKFRKRSQLKSHFILHLDNNPWTCPVPGCNVKLDSQPSFRLHDQWHFGLHECCKKCGYTCSSTNEMKSHNCFPQYPAPDLSKRRVKGGANKSFELTKSHYENLKAKGLLLGNQRILVDSDYQIDMDRLIEIDPVFLQLCKEKPEFRSEIFGIDEDEPVQPTTSKAQEASDYNLAKALEIWERGSTSERYGLSEGQLFGLVRMSYQYDNDAALDGLDIRAFTPNNPYACPLKGCKAKVKLGNKDELKTHFVLHLKNNPYACPIPECKEGMNLTTHGDFQRHLEWHMGTHQHRSQEDEEKSKEKEDAAKCCVRGHYFDLKAKGLLLEESPEHLLNFDFKFKIDIDTVIQTDPVFLQVCKHDTRFYDRLFGDELPSASTSATSLRNIVATMDVKNLASHIRNSFDFDDEQWRRSNDSDSKDLGEIIPYMSNKPFACPLMTCKTGSTIKSRKQLKRHFILHLKNNPYACPILECNAKFNAQEGFQYHLDWHMGKHRISPCEKCGQTFSTEDEQKYHQCAGENPRGSGKSQQDEEKLEKEFDSAKCCVKGQYLDLKEKGLLLEESQNHLVEFDFKFKIDIDRIIKTDPVFLEVCQSRTGFYDQIFGDDQDQQPSTSRGMAGSSVQNIIATMDFSTVIPSTNADNVLERHLDSDIEDIGEIRTNYPPDNPFTCPLKTCEVKLTNRSQLKSHFIIHLKNNPYACPIPGCRVRLDAQCKFKHHMEWHLGQDQEKADQAKFCIKKHYADLQSRGLLLEESEEHALKFDFEYKVDIDTIIKTDEVLLKVCMFDETFYDRLFGDEQPQPSTSTSTDGESQLEANLRMENGNNCNEGDASSIVETLKMVKNSVERETAPDEFTPHFEKHESGLAGESSPPEMNETVETESFTAEQTNSHDAGKSDFYLKRLENGQFECTDCRLSCKSEAGGKRHWLLKHNVKISSTKELPSKVGDESGPSKIKLSNGEKPHCSQSSRKRKSPNDIIRDTNVKAVKVEPDLDLGLTLIVPKKEKEEVDCDVDVDVKPEIPTDQIKKEEGEDFITGDVPPSNNV